MNIQKRDGRLVPFDKEKIKTAVLKAFIAIDGEPTGYAIDKAVNIANYVESICKTKTNVSIEEIQDLVEKGLMSTKRKDVARAYITYRNERSAERRRNSELTKIIKEKLSADNVQN